MEVTSTRRPVANQWQMMLAMVWVLPVPGGPCTTTPSCVSSSWTILTCSSLKGLGKYKSFASAGVVTAGSWKMALTPRKAGSCID